MNSITDHQHAVVQLLAAAALLIVDSWRNTTGGMMRPQTQVMNGTEPEERRPTGLVELEVPVTGVDGDRHGSDGGDGHLQVALAAFGDVDEAGVIGGVVLGVVAAVAVLKQEKHQTGQSFAIKQEQRGAASVSW